MKKLKTADLKALSLRKTPGGNWKVKINPTALLKLCLLLGCLSWLLVATGLYYNFKLKKDFDDVSYIKMLALPFRLKEHRVEMGEYHIKKGIELIEQRKYGKGLLLLRLGVIRAPKNLEARKTLAILFYEGLGRYDLGKTVLLDGLVHATEDIEYFQYTLRQLQKFEQFDSMEDVGKEYLSQTPLNTQLVIASILAQMQTERGNFEDALKYFENHDLLTNPENFHTYTKCLWETNRQYDAIAQLEHYVTKIYPNSFLLGQLAYYHFELGNQDTAQKYAMLRVTNSPERIDAHIDHLYMLHQIGQNERVQKQVNLVLKSFKTDYSALLELTKFAATTQNIELSKKLYETALMEHFPVPAFLLTYIDTLLQAKDYMAVIKIFNDLDKENPIWIQDFYAECHAFRALAYSGLKDEENCSLHLESALDGLTKDSLNQLQAVSNQLTAQGNPELAYRITSVIAKKDPKFYKEHLQLQLSLNKTENLCENLGIYIQTPKPNNDILQKSFDKLARDEFLYEPERNIALNNTQQLIKTH